jgi:soluble lytic murein transglycosylase-like protein
MEPMSNYYFNGKCYVKRSKWPRRIRASISALFVAFATTFTYEPSYAQYQLFKSDKVKYVEYIQDNNPRITGSEAREIAIAAIKWAQEFKVDEKLLLAMAKVESNFHKHAISSSGAYGIMQVIPVWHKPKILEARNKLGNPELFNINTNLFLGAWVFRDCTLNSTTLNKALLCYSGQTPGYDQKVLAEYNELKKL